MKIWPHIRKCGLGGGLEYVPLQNAEMMDGAVRIEANTDLKVQ